MKTITLKQDEYERLKKKAALADDLILQLESSFQDIREGKIKPWKD